MVKLDEMPRKSLEDQMYDAKVEIALARWERAEYPIDDKEIVEDPPPVKAW